MRSQSPHHGAPLRLACGTLAVLFGVALLAGLRYYPMHKSPLAPLLALYFGLLCWRQCSALVVLPLLLPVLDLAPWTGWFFFEESDLLLLLTAAFGYARLARRRLAAPPRQAGAEAASEAAIRLPPGMAWCAAWFTLACLIGLWRGLLPLAPLDANSFTSYLSPYNSLRVAKPWFWALALLPLLRHGAGAQLAGLRRCFLPAMLGGLALVALACTWERWVFPGLLDFSSDYRTTALFSGMHTGGAALDGYLALSVPLLAIYLLTAQPPRRRALALALLTLALYAGLSTFSRGLFAAFAVAAAVLLAHLAQRRWARRRPCARQLVTGAGAAAGCAILAYGLLITFGSSGYRGLAAALTLLAAAVVLAGLALPRRLLPACLLCGALLGGAIAALPAAPEWPGWASHGWLKRPYLPFLLTALLLGGTAAACLRRAAPVGPLAASVMLVAFAGLAGDTVWIAGWWGGTAALAPAIGIAALALLVLLAPGWRGGRAATPWRIAAPGMTLLAAAVIACGIGIPILASYYASARFATVAEDFGVRTRHWSQVRQIMDDGLATSLFGMGSGTFPATWFWHNPEREVPASLQYGEEAGNRYVELATPTYGRGYGELLRLLQHVAIAPQTPYLLGFDLRRSQADVVLQVRLCQRQLLYPENCVAVPLRQPAPDGLWHRAEVSVDSGWLGAGAWPRRAPVQLEFAVAGGPATMAIDNVGLRGAAGAADLVSNGSFSDGNNYWFFSSDRHHLPWHIKNLPLNLYFELGWFGLLGFAAMLACALRHLVQRARAGEVEAAAIIAAISAFLTVGMFDSLLDVPRISLLFFLLLLLGVLMRPPQPRVKGPAP